MASEGFRKQVYGARRNDLRTSDANPVMRREHSANASLLDPKATVTVHDSG
jgi:hypothetical protein